jgi:autotransporter-associated beta strand protein
VDGGAVLNLTNASGINGSSVNASLTLTGSGVGNITGPVSLGLGNLTVSGGTWTVGPTNSYSGLTTISAGALLLTGPLSLGQPPASFNFSQVTLSGGSLGAASDVTLADGKIGIDVSDASSASGIMVSSNATFVISNNISGSGASFLTKRGPGTLVLEGANDFSGQLNLDSGSTSANDGMTVIANNAAIQNIFAFPGTPFITIRNNNGGSSTLGLDGSNGSITVAPDISLAGRNVVVPAIENLAGDNTVSGNLTLVVGGSYYIQSDSGTLTLAAPLPYQTPSGARTFFFSGDGIIDATGGIQNGSTNALLSSPQDVPVSVVKNGNGILELPSANSYSGTTLVNGGILNVTGSLLGTNTVTVAGGLLVSGGSIAGPVTVQSGGAIEAGTTNTIGTLTLSGALSLSGNTMVKINAQTHTSDLFSGQSSVTYGGILTVTNLGGTLTAGESFTLFSPGSSSGNFSSISGTPGPDLHYSFTNGVLSVENGSAIANNQTNITVSVSGNTLNISWPADHRGWILQAQTNSVNVGLSDNWHDVAGSDSVTNETMTINSTNPAVFYRLRHP